MAGSKSDMPSLNVAVGNISTSSNRSGTNNAISAAADSSDNHPSTPTPDKHFLHHQSVYSSNTAFTQLYSSIYPQEVHSYPTYSNSYEQFYHNQAGIDYGGTTSGIEHGSQERLLYQPGAHPHSDFKLSSVHYHPYLSNNGLVHATNNNISVQINDSNHSTNIYSIKSSRENTLTSTPATTLTTATATPGRKFASMNSLSPRVVSSTSPTLANNEHSTVSQNIAKCSQSPQNPLHPPESIKQDKKCNIVCKTESEQNDHYSIAREIHSQTVDCLNRDLSTAANDIGPSSIDVTGSFYSYSPYVKEEPASDILDLDSQKMVYPVPLPLQQKQSQVQQHNVQNSLNPLHSMRAMQRPLLLQWNQDVQPHDNYMELHQSDQKQQSQYYSPKQAFSDIKSEFPSPNLTCLSAIHTTPEIKHFETGSDLSVGSKSNPISSSPAEFPSTTTPQDVQYRNFEPPTSSVPCGTPTTKAATWKSNEARRPKTYNCTACNKWFTSSGHLKRHYNTTLHKNAVKSSGQPDPATMPISAHHHPSRDPHLKHRNSRQQLSQELPDPPRSPAFSPQCSAQSTNGLLQAQQKSQQTFDQYQINSPSSNSHPNGLAGPSEQPSQSRGLLIISSPIVSIMNQEEEHKHIYNQHREEEERFKLLYQQQHQQINHQQQSHNLYSLSSNDQVKIQGQNQETYNSLYQPNQIYKGHPTQRDTNFKTPTTTINNTMDQQQPYILSPLAINTPITLSNTTTIPSFQHLQLPSSEHLTTCHTIIGNNVPQISSNPYSDNLLQLSSADVSPIASSTKVQHQIHQTNHHQMMTATDGHILQLIPTSVTKKLNQNEHQSSSIFEMQRFEVDVSKFKKKFNYPISPIATDSYNRLFLESAQRSPQEADVPSPHSTTSAQLPETTTKNSSYPYSPTISSSTPVLEDIENNNTINKNTNKKLSLKRKRGTSTVSKTLPTENIKCNECKKEFTKICYLTQHNKTFHSGEQPYRCQKCGKRFQSEESYFAHLERHKSQDKPFKCDACPKQFHHKTDLRRHKEAIHTGFKAHTCDTCNKSFCRKDHLRKHCDTHNKLKSGKNSNKVNSITESSKIVDPLKEKGNVSKESLKSYDNKAF